MKTKDLIIEALSLPVEERAMFVDSLLKSLNPLQSEIDEKWAKIAKHRLNNLRSGGVASIPGNSVSERIRSKFSE